MGLVAFVGLVCAIREPRLAVQKTVTRSSEALNIFGIRPHLIEFIKALPYT